MRELIVLSTFPITAAAFSALVPPEGTEEHAGALALVWLGLSMFGVLLAGAIALNYTLLTPREEYTGLMRSVVIRTELRVLVLAVVLTALAYAWQPDW